MAYTVKKISELSGVTIRALHFYERKGILKPAYYGSNGYRYYEEKELLQLQQILFFKSLGMSISQIQKVMGRDDFDQLRALYSHQVALKKEKEKIEQLLKTVEHTIQHLKGKKKMKEKEFFDGFVLVKIDPKCEAEDLVLKNLRKNGQDREVSYYEETRDRAHEIFQKLVGLMQKSLEPNDSEVQKVVKEHHAFSDEFHVASQAVYKALATLYREHKDYRKQMDPFHPELADFLSDAMVIYANTNLS